MNNNLKHAQRKTTTPQPDGTELILTEGFHEKLNSITEEIRQSIRTNKASFVADLMHCIRPISDGISSEVHLQIVADEQGQPIRIVKTWTVRKEHYGR